MPLIFRVVVWFAHRDATALTWRTVLLAINFTIMFGVVVFGEEIVRVGHYPLNFLHDLPAEGLPEKGRWLTTGTPKLKFRGRVDSDFIRANQSAANEEIFGQLGDSDGLRRARLGIEGQWTPETRYLAELDFASGQVVVRDLFVGWGQVHDGGEFRVGHFREPFSLEGGTSANSFAMMERSSINELDPARNWGLGYFRCSSDEDSTFAIGIFHAGTDSSDFQNGPGSNTAITARTTMLPWDTVKGTRFLHLGLAASVRMPDDGLVLISQGPGSPLLDLGDSSTSPFVPEIQIAARSQQLLNAQWALVNGPFSAQAEWYGSLIDQIGGGSVFFHGSYLQVSYFLTGDHRSYDPRHGVFGSVAVARPVLPGLSNHSKDAPRGLGAWELTARMGYLDFQDFDTPPGPDGQLVGVRLPHATFGVNWYLADRLRILFNYSLALPEEPNTGSSTANILSTRLALHW